MNILFNLVYTPEDRAAQVPSSPGDYLLKVVKARMDTNANTLYVTLKIHEDERTLFK